MPIRNWLGERLGGIADEILGFIILVVLLPALYEWIRGNPDTAMQWVILVFVVVNIFLTWSTSRQKLSPEETETSEQLPRGILVREAEGDKRYLVDFNGLFREINDDDTFSFLEVALGITGGVSIVANSEVATRLGKEVPAIKDYKRPLTPEEQRVKQLRRRVDAMLSVETFCMYNNDPQLITVQFTNDSRTALFISRVEFMPTQPDMFIYDSFRRTEKAGVFSCLDEGVNLSPGDKHPITLPLTAKWAEGDLERRKGNVGFLTIWVQFEGEEVDLLTPL